MSDWISVKDELPALGQTVWISAPGETSTLGWYSAMKEWHPDYDCEGIYVVESVSHWMEADLPERPPK